MEWVCWYCGIIATLETVKGGALEITRCSACGAPVAFGPIMVMAAPLELQPTGARKQLKTGRPRKASSGGGAPRRG